MALDEESTFLKLPEIEGAEYIVGLLQEAGLVSNGGMGVVPLTWSEIESWHRFTQLDLSIWERLMIRTLSEEYASELHRASAKDAPAPYVHVNEVQIDRKAVANKIMNVFRSFKRDPEPEPTDPNE